MKDDERKKVKESAEELMQKYGAVIDTQVADYAGIGWKKVRSFLSSNYLGWNMDRENVAHPPSNRLAYFSRSSEPEKIKKGLYNLRHRFETERIKKRKFIPGQDRFSKRRQEKERFGQDSVREIMEELSKRGEFNFSDVRKKTIDKYGKDFVRDNMNTLLDCFRKSIEERKYIYSSECRVKKAI